MNKSAKTYINPNGLLDEWCKVTSCHGVKEFNTSKRLEIKLFWATLLVLAFLALFSQITALLITFKTNPYTTHVETTVASDGVEFPNITICNLNRFSRFVMEELMSAAEYLSRIFASELDSFFPTQTLLEELHTKQRNSWISFIESEKGNRYKSDLRSGIRRLATKLALPCQKTFISCTSVLRGRFPNFDCCHENFSVFNNFGFCSVIRPPPKKRKQYFAGYYYGITIIVDPQLSAYSSLTMNSAISEGVVLSMNGNPYEPVPLDPIYIKPATFASIAISLETTQLKLSSRFILFQPPCQQKLQSPILKKAINYIKLQYYSDVIRRDLMDTDLQYARQYLRDCSSVCYKSPCERHVKFKYSVSYAGFPNSATKEHIEEQLTWSMTPEVKKYFDVHNLIKLNIYFKHIGAVRTEIRETETIYQLIANIGGQLGIWMGISIVTVVQALVYFTVTCFNWCRRDDLVKAEQTFVKTIS